MRNKKRLIIMLIILSLVTTSVTFSYWASEILGSSTNSSSNINIGNWVEDGYIPIFNEEDFIQQVEKHDETTKIVLMKDVEINITAPLKAFSGTLDGNGYTVTNTGTISQTVSNGGNIYVGLFERINENAEVRNLVLDGIHINASTTAANNSYAAVLAAYNNGTVENVAVKNSSVNFTHSINTSGIELHVHVSGLVGENGPNAKAEINNSYSTAIVTGTVIKTGNNNRVISLYVGGLVGKNVSGKIYNSYATGNITGYAANRAGSNNENRLARVYAGGLVGFNDNYNGGTAEIQRSFATGNILVNRATKNGGSNIIRLYAGRLVGNNGGTVTASYYLSGQTLSRSTSTSSPTFVTHSSQGTAASISNLRSLSVPGLSDWNDEEIVWEINTNSYPTLLMEKQ